MKNKLLSIVLIAILLLICISCSSEKSDNSQEIQVPEYVNVSSSEYVQDGKTCCGYRVVVSDNLNDEELEAVFNDVTNDDYHLHTVWFYDDESLASGGDIYNVAMLEEEKEIGQISITRP